MSVDAPIEELVDLLWQVTRQLRRVGKEWGSDPLTPTQRFLLFHLYPQAAGDRRKAGGPQRVSELAASLRLTTSAVTQMVTELESLGLVRRERNERDRRVVIVSLTEAGSREIQAGRERRRAFAAAYLSRLDAEDRRDLQRILTKLLVDAGRVSERAQGEGTPKGE